MGPDVEEVCVAGSFGFTRGNDRQDIFPAVELLAAQKEKARFF